MGRLRHTGQISGFDQLERVLSAVLGLDGRLRGSKKCESTGAVGRTVGGGKGHQHVLTMKYPRECVADKPRVASLCFLVRSGLAGGFCGERRAFLISSNPSSLTRGGKREDVSV